jgi:hypothetical protein
MNYREQLQKARELGISVIDLEIATEVESMKDDLLYYDLLNKTMSEEEFELCCALIEEVYLKSEGITINQLVRALYGIVERYVHENDYEGTLEEIIKNIGKTTLIEEACWYE